MMTNEQNIRAILECLFSGYKDEIIDTASKSILDTIDSEPIKHGEWLEPEKEGSYVYDKNAYAKCSVCGGVEFLGYRKKYCPNCGAKMD